MSDKSSGGSRMAEHAQNVKDEGASAMHDAAGAASAMASKYAKQAQDYAKQGYDMAAEKTAKVKEQTEGYITENPWYAVGIALGVGVLLGLVLRGSGRD